MPQESYIIPLQKAYDKPRTRRANVAVSLIFDFLRKHTRKEKEDVILTKEVNEFIWSKSIEKPPRQIPVSIRIKENKVYVFLKGSKEIETFFNKQNEVKKKSLKEKVTEIKENIQEGPKADKKGKTEAKVEIPVSKPKKETDLKETVPLEIKKDLETKENKSSAKEVVTEKFTEEKSAEEKPEIKKETKENKEQIKWE